MTLPNAAPSSLSLTTVTSYMMVINVNHVRIRNRVTMTIASFTIRSHGPTGSHDHSSKSSSVTALVGWYPLLPS